ncbi:MAG: hypothetical protein V1719_01175 [Patescibacteria group bacterium]
MSFTSDIAARAISLAENFKTFMEDLSEATGFTFIDTDTWDQPISENTEESTKSIIEGLYENQTTVLMTHISNNIKLGRATFTAASTVAITGLGFDDNEYSISLTPSTDVRTRYTLKTSNGFTINTSAVTTGTVDWIAIHG